MKKIIVVLLSVFVILALHAQEEEYSYQPVSETEKDSDPDLGFFISGGVKTGLLIRNRDFGGALGSLALSEEHKYPLTLHFASHENSARNGEGWFNIGYKQNIDEIGMFGLQMGFWAHGDIHNYNDAVRMGDHFVWANFANERLRFIGGQGGGTPITSGGWINADWLGYTGLRVFWVDPSGISAGFILPDPGQNGVKPVNYLTLLGFGVSFKQENWWISGQMKNAPVYDDSESNFYGGLHRHHEQDPIAMAGNIAFGMGVENLFGTKLFITFETMLNNLGEDDFDGMGNYTISPVSTVFALKTGITITDNFYAELKGKYTISQGDDSLLSRPINWGRFEYEPYISFKPLDHLTIHLAVYGAIYFNSYYLALDASPTGTRFYSGQAPDYSMLRDYLSAYQLGIKPKISFHLSGIDMDFGYDGNFSRDHVENKIYLDFRWMF